MALRQPRTTVRSARSRLRELARERLTILLKQALREAPHDLALAKRQAAIARRLASRYNVRLRFPERILFCRGCKGFLAPGINARIRLGDHPRGFRVTCLECGHVYRKLLQPANKNRVAWQVAAKG